MKLCIFVLFFSVSSKILLAVPSAFTSKCGSLDIINNTTSTILSDNENCKTAWVLPPTYGVVSLSGYTPSGNLGMCQEVKSVQDLSRNLVERIASLTQEVDSFRIEYQAKEKELIDAKAQYYELERSPEYKEITNIENQISLVERRIEKLLEQLTNCSENCMHINDELQAKREERHSLKDQLIDVKDKYFDLVQEHRLAKGKLESAQFAFDTINNEINVKIQRAIMLKTTLQQWLMFYAKLEGGTAHLDYDTQWVQNAIKLNEKYQGKYQFMQIPTRNARISANFVGSNDKETYLSSMPAILDYSINGMKFTPWGENGAIEHASLPSRLSGSVRLSMLGGCPMYYKNFLESDTLIKDDTINKRMNFSLAATYEYPAAFKFNVTASYNLYKMYEKISTASSHGGFFSREQYTSVVEDRADNDGFSIEWHLEDEKYSDQEKEEIRKALRAELIGRVLSTLATPIYTKTHLADAVVPTNTGHGALVIATGINRTCGYYNIWCQGAVWVFRGLDAIFGSSSAETKFRTTHNRTAVETWNTSETRWRTAATGFVGI